jgi:DNA-binding transcriptional ArsR family regulator
LNVIGDVKMNRYQEQARLFHILSHPARLQILDILRGGEECVCHIQSVLGKRQAYISQQLMVLRDAGLVVDSKDGQYVFYRLADAVVSDVLSVVLGPVQERSCCEEPSCPHCHQTSTPACECKIESSLS